MDSSNWRIKREPEGSSSRDASRDETWGRPTQQPRRYDPDGRRGPNRYHDQQEPSDTVRQPLNETQAEQAIEEGRRLYVGNLPYEASLVDIETLFKDIKSEIQAVNMSVDPMTGRNPSYCFVDFTSKVSAERVMQEYNGRLFLGRPLKVKPGVKSGTGKGRYDLKPGARPRDFYQSPVYDRWNRLEAPEHFQTAIEEGRRLYVGGLPKFAGQIKCNTEIQELFRDFQVEAVSKLLFVHESRKDEPGNHNYCFVQMATKGEAFAAAKAVNGIQKWGSKLTVNVSSGGSVKFSERRRIFVGGLPDFEDHTIAEAGIRELFKDYEVREVSKLYGPSEAKKLLGGSHSYCFVELADEEQTDSAIEVLDWTNKWGGELRVKHATGPARMTREVTPQRAWR